MNPPLGYQVWYRNDEACAQAILSDRPVEVQLSSYGANDFVLDFLVGSGLWGILTSMEPDELRKENGKPWHALNGVEVLRELARIDRIGRCGKILRDVRLMLIAGFNAEEVQRACSKEKPVVDTETLANHLARISPTSAARTFCEHVALLKRKRWIRGNVYVADAHEIILPYGRQSERMGQIGEKYGYKLVVLLNATEGKERVVGFVLAPLQASERTLLRIILRGLKRQFGPLREWMHLLLLDRGYWGAEYLLGLHRRYGIDLVTLAGRDELAVVADLNGLARPENTPWQWQKEEHSHLGQIQVRTIGFEGVPLCNAEGRVVGRINAVVADEFDPAGQPLKNEKGEDRPRWHYISTLATASDPYKTRTYYRGRWVIENQGFRELTQQWALDCPAGRRFNALNSRIAFALMLDNAERILSMKHPGPWQEERERLQALGVRDHLDGPSIAAYTPGGDLGAFTTEEYGQLIAQRERNRIVHTLREGLARGESLERMLDRLENKPPRQA